MDTINRYKDTISGMDALIDAFIDEFIDTIECT